MMTLTEALAVSAAAEPRYEAGAWCSHRPGMSLTAVHLRNGQYSFTEHVASDIAGGPWYLPLDTLCLFIGDERSYHWFCNEGDPALAGFHGLDWHPAYGADASTGPPAAGENGRDDA